MSRMTTTAGAMGLLCLCALLASGCRSSTPRYYLLHAGSEIRSPATKLTIGVGPITFPDHLDRTDIVRRKGKTELKLWTKHRWAERPATNFTSVLAENLVALVGTNRVVIYPWDSSITPDVAIRVVVSRFDVDTAGNAQLAVAWSVERANNAAIVIRRTRYQIDSKGKSAGAAVEAMSEALYNFCTDVSRVLK